MAAPVALNGVDKLPYVRLERLNDGAQPPVDHTQRIPLADRNPVVLLQRLPLDLPGDNVEGCENQSLDGSLPPIPSADQDDGEDSTSDGRKRSLTPPLFTPSSSGTPSKRVRFSSGGSGGRSARRQLWTRLQHEAVAPILKPKSSATKENLSVLLGVKSSRGVPIVSLERLKLSGGLLTGASASESRPARHNEDTDVEEETSTAGSSASQNGEPTEPGRRAATSSCGYQQMDSSDDN